MTNRRVTAIAALRPRTGYVVALATAGALALFATGAQAHISVHPNTVPAGAFATLDVRVPGEQENAHVTRVDTLLPPGFTSVDYENVPGWTVREITTKLAHPIQSDGGPITQEISQIIWTWTGPLGEVGNGQFIQFPLSVAIPDRAGRTLQFKTVQTYSNGQVTHWIDPSLDDQYPAPTIDVTRAGGVIEDLAGAEAGPQPGQGSTVATAKTAGGASTGLAIVALAVGALGLIVAVGAVARMRHMQSAP